MSQPEYTVVSERKYLNRDHILALSQTLMDLQVKSELLSKELLLLEAISTKIKESLSKVRQSLELEQ